MTIQAEVVRWLGGSLNRHRQGPSEQTQASTALAGGVADWLQLLQNFERRPTTLSSLAQAQCMA